MNDLPTAFALPAFNLPDLLTGSTAPFSHSGWAWVKKQEEAVGWRLEATGFTVGEIDLGAFMRMLAKIAHAYLVSQLGLGTFNPLLIDLILNGGEDAPKWVGGLPMQPATKNLHTLSCGLIVRGQTTYHYVDIRLFAQIGAPTYRVLVGNM